MKPSTHTHQSQAAISHRRTRANYSQIQAPRPSIEWINPAMRQYSQSVINHSKENDLEPNIIINELIDHNSDIINSTTNPLDSSLVYVKSIIPSMGTTQYR